MQLKDIALPEKLAATLASITELRPCQEKAVNAGLLEGKNLLVCTPTASGKTLIAEIAMMKTILDGNKAIYIVPLVALASEKVKQFKQRYSSLCSIALSIGDFDSADPHLANYDLVVCTAEKLDSLLRHKAPWVSKVRCIITDEVHMLNDPGRGPTLEVLLTLLRAVLPKAQLISLSATIGNPAALAKWLQAELIIDDWRPTVLRKGIYYDEKVYFDE
jgi:helicase